MKYLSVCVYWLLSYCPRLQTYSSLLCFVMLRGWNTANHSSLLAGFLLRLCLKGTLERHRKIEGGNREILLQLSINCQPSLWKQQWFQYQQLVPVSNFLLLCFSCHSQTSLIKSPKILILPEQAATPQKFEFQFLRATLQASKFQ